MRGFEGGVASNFKARFEVFGIGAFGCADKGFGLAAAVVMLKVEGDDESFARFSGGEDAIDEQKAFDFVAENTIGNKVFHVVVYAGNAFFVLIVVEIDFGIDEVQR